MECNNITNNSKTNIIPNLMPYFINKAVILQRSTQSKSLVWFGPVEFNIRVEVGKDMGKFSHGKRHKKFRPLCIFRTLWRVGWPYKRLQ